MKSITTMFLLVGVLTVGFCQGKAHAICDPLCKEALDRTSALHNRKIEAWAQYLAAYMPAQEIANGTGEGVVKWMLMRLKTEDMENDQFGYINEILVYGPNIDGARDFYEMKRVEANCSPFDGKQALTRTISINEEKKLDVFRQRFQELGQSSDDENQPPMLPWRGLNDSF